MIGCRLAPVSAQSCHYSLAGNIGDTWSFKKGSDQGGIFLIGASRLSIFSLSFSLLRSGVLETPVRFTWLQTSSSGFNVLLYELGFVGWQHIHRQMHRLVAIAHRPLEQLDGQLAVEAASIGRISVGCFRVDRGCGADRLPLAGPRNHRSLALPGPGFAMHGVGPKARFVPEIHFTAYSFRRSGNGWIRFALPAFNPLFRRRIRQRAIGKSWFD